MFTKRTKKTSEKYLQHLKTHKDTSSQNQFSVNGDTVLKDFTYWDIVPAAFPYDRIFSKHHLLKPKRVFASLSDATKEELEEYMHIIDMLEKSTEYESLLQNFAPARSIQSHFHVHLVVWKIH